MAPSGRFLLEISYANASNRLLSEATVSTNADGNAASLTKNGSKTGQFTLAPGTGAAKWLPAGGSWPAPDLHPRIALAPATGVTRGTGGTLRIVLDLTFLDLTPSFGVSPAAPKAAQCFATLRA